MKRPAPELVATISFEGGGPVVRLLAFSYEDVSRFREWLRANHDAIPELLIAVMDAEEALLAEHCEGLA